MILLVNPAFLRRAVYCVAAFDRGCDAAFWRPKTLLLDRLGSDLHPTTFSLIPASLAIGSYPVRADRPGRSARGGISISVVRNSQVLLVCRPGQAVPAVDQATPPPDEIVIPAHEDEFANLVAQLRDALSWIRVDLPDGRSAVSSPRERGRCGSRSQRIERRCSPRASSQPHRVRYRDSRAPTPDRADVVDQASQSG